MSKRVLSGLVLAAAAFVATPAQAAPDDPVTIVINENEIRVGTQVGSQPLVGASVDRDTLEVCAGFSTQIPVCTPPVGPIS